MTDVVTKLDDFGMPAWIAVMVLGFIVFWPIGLAILAYLIWSGRMGCGRYGARGEWGQRMASRWERKMEHWGRQAHGFRPSGNHAFDEYREATLKRLEEEEREFRDFLDRLRHAKDKAEFDQFMADRREGATRSPPGEPSAGGQEPEPRPAG